MRRREFISLIGGVAATWPLAARAQQTGDAGGRVCQRRFCQGGYALFLSAFLKGLSETGYVDGRTWRSNTAGRRAKLIVCRQWWLIWFIAR